MHCGDYHGANYHCGHAATERDWGKHADDLVNSDSPGADCCACAFGSGGAVRSKEEI